MNRDLARTREAISHVHLDCPVGAMENTQPWSKLGAMKFCELNGLQEGPWEAWEHGVLQIRGGYAAGEADGAWRYYDDQGRVIRAILYESGVEADRIDNFDIDLWSKGEDAQWTSAPPAPRLEMADRLVESEALVGMSQTSVAALLGPPTQTDKFQDWDLVYWLGVERGYLPIDSEWLVIRFDADRRVSEVRIVPD